jgi:uncharacterized protein with ParB-like and HNH nuclease domain
MFSINSKICTLKYNNVQKGNVLLTKNKKYIIPIYQRPYEWEEEHIQRLISDIFISFRGITGHSPPEKMFCGSMQLSKKNEKNEHELIDGQQRMTTLLLLLFVIKNIFPEEKEIKNFDFSLLSTKVNSGKQQEYLNKVLASGFKSMRKGANSYQNNVILIKKYVEEQREKSEFDHNKLIMHILSNIYFAVIETNTKLSKTLQIFNSINTAGKILEGTDIFKIRVYEYLHDIKKQDESIFERIDRLYKSIIDNNEKLGEEESSMDEILRIYQYIIISNYKLPVALFNYAPATFFNQLFDTILKSNIWEHFKSNKKIEVSLETLEKIIKIRYEWANSPYKTAEDGCAISLIDYSRYSKYYILIFIYLFSFREQKNYFHNLMLFIRKLSKLYTIFSIRFRRPKSEIDKFTYELIGLILKGNNENVMNSITNKIGKLEDHQDGWNNLDDILGGIIYDNKNNKLKNIVCRLSAMLHEDYHSNRKKIISEIKSKIFDEDDISIDIEHIQSYKDENEYIRDDIWDKWGDDINSIGNLMVLEYNINRSIRNKEYSVKTKKYNDSIFKVVKDQIKNYKNWDIDDCKNRKEQEVKNIIKYLFS